MNLLIIFFYGNFNYYKVFWKTSHLRKEYASEIFKRKIIFLWIITSHMVLKVYPSYVSLPCKIGE